MKFYLGVTDTDWYRYLREYTTEDVNFWQPGGSRQFTAVPKGAPFLFKLKAPHNAIGGLGFFSASATQTIEAAWDYFGRGNGCPDFRSFRDKIAAYKAKNGGQAGGPIVIGCIVLTDPIFFNDDDWIPAPSDWSAPIVQGKGYDDSESIGAALWDQVRLRLDKYRFYERSPGKPTELAVGNDDERYRETVARVRLGQGAFRLLVTNAYERACAITGDHTLPVLEAAHIKPYADSGPHLVSNGLLLRSDLHKLFDAGYMTVTPDLRVEISGRIKEEYHNGKEYYAMHGRRLAITPSDSAEMPDRAFLAWHNENVYKAG
jgi:putative restriction endonuclease